MITPPLGQDKLVGFFKKAIREDSLGHAYIIEGDTGIGKKTLAGYFAAMAVCAEGTACGNCKQCKQTIAEVNPDISVLTVGEKSSIGVDAVREFISTVAYRSIHGGRRVYIIHDADLLTVQAQNALLKVIEEPPKGVLFILLCKQKAQLLRTITSRSQILKLSPLPKEILSKIVPESREFELSYCKGNPGTLIRICADEEFKEFRSSAIDVIAKVFTGSDEALYDAVDFFESNKERKDDLFSITLYVLRDVMYKKNGLAKFIVNSDMVDVINAVSAVLTPVSCMRAIETVLDAERGMGKYGNFTLAVQAMFIRCRNAMKNGNNKQMR